VTNATKLFHTWRLAQTPVEGQVETRQMQMTRTELLRQAMNVGDGTEALVYDAVNCTGDGNEPSQHKQI